MIVAYTRAELKAARAKRGSPVVLVPTMGALHEGHQALLRKARELAGPGGTVVVSIFVNPLQFGPGEDLDRYPRTLPEDLEACAASRADIVFAPNAREMYPEDQLVTVDPGPAGEILEGEFRPGFFRGVLTVVLKLFSLVRPDIATFGEKDAQQLALVRRMVSDFALGIEIESVSTVRERDGLAASSRNKYLSSPERSVAPVLHHALAAGAASATAGPRAVLDAARGVLNDAGSAVSVDYVEVVEGGTFRPVRDDDYRGAAVLALAARVGATRLIDNIAVRFDAADN